MCGLMGLPGWSQVPSDTVSQEPAFADSTTLSPQQGDADTTARSGAAPARVLRAPWLPEDSLALFSYPAHRPWERHMHDLPGLGSVRRYDPLDQPGDAEYARLHNLGTSAYALEPQAVKAIGFEAGGLALRPYLLTLDSLRFLLSRTPYSDVYYSQGPTSEDGLFKGKLSRRFGKGTDFHIEALRIYNIGEYSRLANHHSSLRTGLRYQAPSGRYAIALLHGNHVFDQEESGGIRTDTLLGETFYLARVNVPVVLGQARFRYRELDYQVSQQLALAGAVDRDSLGRILLRHRIRWQERRFKYSDTRPSDGAGFYGPLATDDRGIRQYTTWSTLSNLGTALLSWQSAGGHAISLEGGLEHRLHRWNNEGTAAAPQNLLLVAEMDLRWRSVVDIRASGQLDLGDQVGSWYLDGSAALRTGTWGRLVAGLALNRRFADLFDQQLVVSRREVYAENWALPQHQALQGRLELPGLRLTLGAQFHLLTDAIWYESPGLPRQLNATVDQGQVWIDHHLRVSRFHLEQRLMLQRTGDDRLPLPGWISRHDLYYEGLWFRKSLRTRIGAELRLVGPWSPMAYMPVHQAFMVQDTYREDWFPQLDLYAAVERLGFRFFFELENAGQMVFGWKGAASNGVVIPRVFSMVSGYPMPENWLRFGLAFTFRG